MQEAGASTVVAGATLGPFAGKHGYPSEADALIEDMDAGDFTALVIPLSLKARQWVHRDRPPPDQIGGIIRKHLETLEPFYAAEG